MSDNDMNFFYTRRQLEKIKIFSSLKLDGMSSDKNHDLQSISKRKFNELVRDLNEDIQNIGYNATLNVDGRDIFFNKKIQMEEYAKINNLLTFNYLKESGMFQLLLYIFEKRSFQVTKAASALCYSESYVYKFISRIKLVLNKLDFDIMLVKDTDQKINLVGNESEIRFVHYILTTILYKGDKWLFRDVSEKKLLLRSKYLHVDRYSQWSPMVKKKIINLLAIYELPFAKGNGLDGLFGEINSLAEIIVEHTIDSEYSDHLKLSNNDIKHLNLLASHLVPEFLSRKEIESIGTKFHLLSDNMIVYHCTQILREVANLYSISRSNYFLLMFRLCNSLAVIHYLEFFKLMPLQGVPELSTDLEKSLSEIIDCNLTQYRKSPSFEKIKYNFTQVISGYIGINEIGNYKLYIEFTHRPEYKSLVENSINVTYNKKIFEIVDDYLEADIIISDSYNYPEKKYFYFGDVFDSEAWKNLGFYLNGLIDGSKNI
ncbi:helix-turn-helix domain-containing protein [Enterococcus faecalis]